MSVRDLELRSFCDGVRETDTFTATRRWRCWILRSRTSSPQPPDPIRLVVGAWSSPAAPRRCRGRAMKTSDDVRECSPPFVSWASVAPPVPPVVLRGSLRRATFKLDELLLKPLELRRRDDHDPREASALASVPILLPRPSVTRLADRPRSFEACRSPIPRQADPRSNVVLAGRARPPDTSDGRGSGDAFELRQLSKGVKK